MTIASIFILGWANNLSIKEVARFAITIRIKNIQFSKQHQHKMSHEYTMMRNKVIAAVSKDTLCVFYYQLQERYHNGGVLLYGSVW